MDFSYSKDNVLVFAEFCNYRTSDTKNKIVWTNDKIEVTFLSEIGNHSSVQWKLCDFEWKFDE